MAAAEQNLEEAREHAGEASKRMHDPSEVVADKGYHSKMVMLSLQLGGWRSYIAEPRRGRQHWEGETEERDAVYGNRRRKNGHRGRHLMRLRGEIIERTFAHVLETGGMRRLYLCHQENIAKRLLVHIAGYNLGLLMRKRFGVGKPRCLQGHSAALWGIDHALGPAGFAHAAARDRQSRESAGNQQITRPVARSGSRMSEAIHATKTTGC